MNVGEVINILPGKTAGKKSLNGKSINIVDFKKLVSGLFSSKKDKSDTEVSSDILSLLISQYSSGNLSEKGINLNEIKTADNDKIDISSIISKLNIDDIKSLLSENFMTSDNINTAKADNIKSLLKESLNIPENSGRTISAEDFKGKLTEFISKTDNKSQTYESTKLEDYGNFKKAILINRRNGMLSIKEEPIKTEADNMQKQSVKTERSVSYKETNEAKESIKVKDSDNVFSSVINKLELKNTSIKGETQLPEIRKENLNEDVIKTISFMKDNDIKNLTVKVVPKELGEITIELIYTGDKINAKLTSSSNSTFQLLDQNVSILNSELSKNGVNLQNVNVSLYSGDFSENERNQGQEYKRRDERKQVQEISSDEPIDEFGNINIFA